jgi:nucleoside-diphosphate kinase
MDSEKTYIMIKPDAVASGKIGRIITRFEDTGLSIERMELATLSREQAAANYAEHEGKPFYDGLIDYITSGPVVKMVVSGPNAVAVSRKLMGPTNPAEAAPGTIRGDFGLLVDANVVHGSDSPASAEREVALFFNDNE